MSTATLDDIPYEVFINGILPLISIKEVGSLTMISPVWRDMCNEQEVWRKLYMRGLNFKVTDESVPLGKCCRRRTAPFQRPSVMNRRGLPIVDLNDPDQTWMKNAQSALPTYGDYLLCDILSCVPAPLKMSLKSWTEVRQDGCADGWFGVRWRGYGNTCGPEYRANLQMYLDYIEGEWKSYNENLGLSQVNLCQCASHYRFETLDGPSKCRNSSSFKSVVLKKQLTVSKGVAKKTTSLLHNKARIYEEYRVHAALLEAELLSIEIEEKRCSDLCEKLRAAVAK
jgi:hypothetical protein